MHAENTQDKHAKAAAQKVRGRPLHAQGRPLRKAIFFSYSPPKAHLGNGAMTHTPAAGAAESTWRTAGEAAL